MEKIKVTAQQRANAIEALEVMWPSVPPENVYRGLARWLKRYGTKRPTCGTVACFGGWCAFWPNFKAQGVVRDYTGRPVVEGGDPYGAHAKLFGPREQYLFFSRDIDDIDKGFTGTDHELVTHRLNWLIANSEVIS